MKGTYTAIKKYNGWSRDQSYRLLLQLRLRTPGSTFLSTPTPLNKTRTLRTTFDSDSAVLLFISEFAFIVFRKVSY